MGLGADTKVIQIFEGLGRDTDFKKRLGPGMLTGLLPVRQGKLKYLAPQSKPHKAGPNKL